MIKAIANMDPKKAARLLARAAGSLTYASDEISPDEDRLRQSIIQEVRASLGIAKSDVSSEAFERIGAALDDASDELLAVDTNSALTRLAERGDLPSDLYKLDIIANIREIYGKHFDLERDIIETTVRAPDDEQHFGPATIADEPPMISLFVKHFRTVWPLRDFRMLVAGGREGFILHIHQAWRLYPTIIDGEGARTPIELLRKFLDKFGADVEIAGRVGRFFLSVHGNIPTEHVKIRPNDKGKPERVSVSRFMQTESVSGRERASLVTAVSITKYQSMMKDLRVSRKDILTPFVKMPN